MNVEQEIRELRRRVDQAEASIARLGQAVRALRAAARRADLCTRFAEVDERFDAVDESWPRTTAASMCSKKGRRAASCDRRDDRGALRREPHSPDGPSCVSRRRHVAESSAR